MNKNCNEIVNMQIGHSQIKENDFKIECEVANDKHIEVPFSHRHFFYAIYWIHEGSGKHIIDFEEYDIRPDRIFFIREFGIRKSLEKLWEWNVFSIFKGENQQVT